MTCIKSNDGQTYIIYCNNTVAIFKTITENDVGSPMLQYKGVILMVFTRDTGLFAADSCFKF